MSVEFVCCTRARVLGVLSSPGLTKRVILTAARMRHRGSGVDIDQPVNILCAFIGTDSRAWDTLHNN